MAEFSTRTIVPADGVKLPAVNENLANPSGNMTLSSLKSYVLGTLPTDVQTNTEDIGENTSDIEGIRGSSQAFDATAAYSAGDYCIYENVLYRFTSAKSAGAWDSTIVSVVDLPTLDGAITSLMSLLWTNPNPSSSFAPQTIPLDLSSYKVVFIVTDGGSGFCNVASTGRTISIIEAFLNTIFRTRQFTVNSNGVTATNGGYYAGSFTFNTNNEHAKPQYIYGIK